MNRPFLAFIRLSGIALLALFAALAILYAVLGFGSGAFGRQKTETSTYTDPQKLAILASLASTTTPGEEKKASVLQGLSQNGTSGPSEETKLQILETLQAN